eukprot:3761857-Heterocapsa_arctica.AAC.1
MNCPSASFCSPGAVAAMTALDVPDHGEAGAVGWRPSHLIGSAGHRMSSRLTKELLPLSLLEDAALGAPRARFSSCHVGSAASFAVVFLVGSPPGLAFLVWCPSLSLECAKGPVVASPPELLSPFRALVALLTGATSCCRG